MDTHIKILKNTDTLFHKAGYVPMSEYVDDIKHMKNNGTWKLPLGLGDRLQIILSEVFIRFSWLQEILYIAYPYPWSPSYNILLSYLSRKGVFNKVMEKNEPYAGYYSFFITKKMFNGRILSGQGISKSPSIAMSKAIGEMLERYISGYNDKNRNITYESFEEISKVCTVVYPPMYHRFLPVQKKLYKELDAHPSEKINWVEGHNLITKEKTYIPKQLTSWFFLNEKKEKVVSSFTSSGGALYFTKEGATLRAILEVINRDGFLVHWLTKTSPRMIISDTLPKELQDMIRMFTQRGLSIYVVDVTSLAVPSVCVFAISEQIDTPRIAMSGASATSFFDAIYSALEEMVLSGEALHSNKKAFKDFRTWKGDEFLFEVTKEDRQFFWTGRETIERFEWFVQGERVSYQDITKGDLLYGIDDKLKLEACLTKIASIGDGYSPIVYYPENKLQQKLGFYIAQVFIPKAFPFYLSEKYGMFDSERLKDFTKFKEVRVNKDPHMFS